MSLSTELKWLSIFKIIFGQTNYWFQNFITSNTYHSSETHWVKLLNYTSSDNCRSCWATDKVKEGPWTAGNEMANLGRQGRGRPLSSHSMGSEAQYCCPQADLIQWQAAFCTLYKRQCLPQQEQKWAVHRANTNRQLVSIVSEYLHALETSFKIW